MNGDDAGGPTVGKVHLLSKLTTGVGVNNGSNAVRIMREFGFPTLFALITFALVTWYAKGTREDLRAERQDSKEERAAFLAALERNTAAINGNGDKLSDIKVLLEGHTGLRSLGVHPLPPAGRRP